MFLPTAVVGLQRAELRGGVRLRARGRDGIYDEPGAAATILVGESGTHPTISANGRFVGFHFELSDVGGGGWPAVRDRDPDGNGIFDERGKTKLIVFRDEAGKEARMTANGRFLSFHSFRTPWLVRDRDIDANGRFDEPGRAKTVLIGPHQRVQNTKSFNYWATRLEDVYVSRG